MCVSVKRVCLHVANLLSTAIAPMCASASPVLHCSHTPFTLPCYKETLVRLHILHSFLRDWSGVAKVLCILRHRGVQLILVYSWTRPAILVAGKGRGGMLLFLLFLHFHSCSSFFPVPLFHLFYYLFYLFSPFLWERTQRCC